MPGSDATFSRGMAEVYDRGRSPFSPFAEDIARRMGGFSSGALLEVAAGTGIVTQVLAQALPASVAITATDLNQPMLDFAAGKPNLERVLWLQANAMALPFANDWFDVVVCQFGVMFFPDRRRAHAEARRVLKPGGRYIFNTWDSLPRNPDAEIVERAVAALYPPGSIGFLGRVPFGYYDPALIRADLGAAGFETCKMETIASVFRASARDVAFVFCQGTPLRAEIEAVEVEGVARAVDAATNALVTRFGAGECVFPRQALVVETAKSRTL